MRCGPCSTTIPAPAVSSTPSTWAWWSRALPPKSSTATERVRESEGRYRKLVENAQDVIYRTDVWGFFTYVNPVATRVMGWPTERIVGKNFLELIREDQRGRVEARLKAQFRDRVGST